MAPSWTIGRWTLVAALCLLSGCFFGWCEASRTSGPTKGGSQQEHGTSSLERVKRGWVWNQFFVVEEYTGTEPLYVGKVSLGLISTNERCKQTPQVSGIGISLISNNYTFF